MLPFLAAAAPWVLSIAGSILPQIIDAFRTHKTPEEAQKAVQPKYDELVARMVGSGVPEERAHKMAQELIVPELEKASEAEPMNPILSLGISGLGMWGGAKLGSKLGGALLGKGVKAAATAAPAIAAEAKALRLGHDPRVSASRTPDVIHQPSGDERMFPGAKHVREVDAEVLPDAPFPRLGHEGVERATPSPIRMGPGDERQFKGAKHQPPRSPFPVKDEPEVVHNAAEERREFIPPAPIKPKYELKPRIPSHLDEEQIAIEQALAELEHAGDEY